MAQTSCCPNGYVYIDSSGNYNDPFAGTGHISNSIITPFLNTCVILQRDGFAILPDPTVDPIDCPCCPEGYTYSSQEGICISDTNPKNTTITIPCISCICTPPPPPPCEGCDESSGIVITMQFNPFAKQCTDCNPQDFQLSNDLKLNAFMPYFLIQPNTNNFNLE